MGKEQLSHFYDNLFTNGGAEQAYHKHYQNCFYYPAWIAAMDLLRQICPQSILELGCGPGQFAAMIHDHLNPTPDYLGLDFSAKGIEISRNNCPKLSFEIVDIVKDAIPTKDFDCVVCLETLEHIHADLTVLKKLPLGIPLIFSVPNFNSASHVRWFTDEQAIRKRYEGLVEFKDIKTIQIGTHTNLLFIVKGIRI
ncbi:class I SAM-dependent methyltransferase [Pseudodesulfovibrio senegalensis]|jgi:SAM-dependent methyltransferase|uniref:Class I SAM-dependent methyltransferase n=1 Tax=Pseudodesulfovibrio senegalensis TaxID=1721087 RepID=A0A6N6N2X8_9BACT|nr:class I SAM-dependent methyltransferase [Pseudodesulfovibrio senegalensis]KAB1441396.1 class I SAM-dependent methyltransferase [Pseudodesulfovibrio senegalensis]